MTNDNTTKKDDDNDPRDRILPRPEIPARDALGSFGRAARRKTAAPLPPPTMRRPAAPSVRKTYAGRYWHNPDQVIDAHTGRTALIEAIIRRDLVLAADILRCGANVNKPSRTGKSPLHFAAGTGQAEMIALLLQHGAHVNARCRKGETPLFEALVSDTPAATLRQLLSGGADADIPDTQDRIPLHLAAEKGSPDLLSILARSTQHIDRADTKGFTPLHMAVINNTPAAVQTLLFEKADTAAANNEKWNVLHMALARNDLVGDAILELLLQTNAIGLINTTTIDGKTPLHTAILHKRFHMAEILLRNGANVNAPDKKKITPLQETLMQTGNIPPLAMLFRYGCDARTAPSADVDPPLVLATRVWGNPALVDFLIEKGADIEQANKDGLTPLMVAGWAHSDKSVAVLLNAGADARRLDKNKRNVLHHAGKNLGHAAIKSLIDAGADTEQPDSYRQRTPLLNALWERHTAIAHHLIDCGVNLDAQDEQGFAALHLAARANEIGIVEKLLEKGAAVDIQNLNYKNTPLHIAANLGHATCVRVLLAKQANPNLRDAEGRNPLHSALYNSIPSVQVIGELLAHGADPMMPDVYGNRPFDYAHATHREDLIALFDRYIGSGPHTPRPPVYPHPWRR